MRKEACGARMSKDQGGGSSHDLCQVVTDLSTRKNIPSKMFIRAEVERNDFTGCEKIF